MTSTFDFFLCETVSFYWPIIEDVNLSSRNEERRLIGLIFISVLFTKRKGKRKKDSGQSQSRFIRKRKIMESDPVAKEGELNACLAPFLDRLHSCRNYRWRLAQDGSIGF